MSKFKVGQVWQDSNQENFEILSLEGKHIHCDSVQPVVARSMVDDRVENFTIEGWYGSTKSELPTSNLSWLVKDVEAKYTHGQRLNSAAEVMQALIDGQKLHRKGDWGVNSYIQLQDNRVVDQYGKDYPIKYFSSFHIYTPPKRKVKSERWFALLPRSNRASGDGVYWTSDYESEKNLRCAHPNALAYVRAECEVEVEP